MPDEPSSFRISMDRLDEIPAAISDKSEGVALRARLEQLLETLNSDHAQEPKNQEFLYRLLDHVIENLSSTSEPVPAQSLVALTRLLDNLQTWVTNQDWASSRAIVHPIRQELSILPKEPPPYQQKVSELKQVMGDARRLLRASTTRLATVDEEHQQALEAAVEKAETETNERFETVLQATNLSARKAVDEIDDLKARANEYLEEIRKANRLTADAEVGGAHRDAESTERGRADLWRWIAVGAWVGGAVVAGILLVPQL